MGQLLVVTPPTYQISMFLMLGLGLTWGSIRQERGGGGGGGEGWGGAGRQAGG